MENPKYLVLNPIYKNFKYPPMKLDWVMALNMFNEITYVQELVPIKTYHIPKKNIQDIQNYNIQDYIKFN